MRPALKRITLTGLTTGLLVVLPAAESRAEKGWKPDPEFDEILALDISELTVTSVSKRPQRLNETAAAAYIVTGEDLRRRGITILPDALRMVPGVQVAQVGSDQWAVSVRGFNEHLSNKLLVLIDGRSIYTPVFSGTYWEDKGLLMEDIERIEVIRGPGGTLWGANAVNGVINIITKSARATQGEDYATAGVGTEESAVEGRHSGQTGEHGYYRTYAQYFARRAAETPAGSNRGDDWYRGRTGFRMDGSIAERDDYTIEGEVYDGRQGEEVLVPSFTPPFAQMLSHDDASFGGDLLARWNREISSDSHVSLQGYLDHYTREGVTNGQNITTADIQFQHTLNLNRRNGFIWGADARTYRYEVEGGDLISADQESTAHQIVSAFAQDEIALILNRLYLTLGSKLEYNDFTGIEAEPNVRLAWHPSENQTVWGAVSRAVRIPATVERDVNLVGNVVPTPTPSVLRVIGNPDQESEEAVAYELGYRIQPVRKLSFDTALFYNVYDKLTTVSLPGAPFLDSRGLLTVPFPFSNLGSGDVYGAEEAVNINITGNWRMSASYSYLQMNLDVEPGATASLDLTEKQAPCNQFSLSSYLDLTPDIHWDNMLYYVDSIDMADAYLRYDTQLTWRVARNVDLSLIGRNLLDAGHTEFDNFPQMRIGPSLVGRISWKF